METNLIKLNATEREKVLATLKTDAAKNALAKCFKAESIALTKTDNAVKGFALAVDEMMLNKVYELEGMTQGDYAEHVGLSKGRVSQYIGACRFLRKDADEADKALGDKFNIDALYQLSSVPIGTINDALAKGDIRYGMGPKAIKEWKDSLKLTDGSESKAKPVKTYDVHVVVVKYKQTMGHDSSISETFYHNMPLESFDSEIAEFQDMSCGDACKVQSGIDGIKALFYPSRDGDGHILIEYTEPIKPVKQRKESAKDREIAKLRAALEAAGIKV